MADLTIRNVTIHPLELISIERFEGQKPKSVTGKLSSFLRSSDDAGQHRHPKGEPILKEEKAIRIDPFKSHKTDLRAADRGNEVIRLQFKTDGHHYEVDVPGPAKRSSVMRKLDGGSHDLTAVYAPAGGFLAVFSSGRLHAWMKELHDDWPLPVLSIPGTHNSPTCYKALPSVRCQAVGVPEQLRNGVRFIDIRVSASPDHDNLTLVHGAFPVSLTGSKPFADLCADLYRFLEENPSETVIMSLKREGTGRATDAQMSKHVKSAYVDKRADCWWTEPSVPTLGAARGRIVLVRRFDIDPAVHEALPGGEGFGIDAAAWPDNCEDGHCPGGQIRIQDFYEISEKDNIEKKIEFVRCQLERASEQAFFLRGMPGHEEHAPTPPLFVNFLSASNFFNTTCWPERIAAKVNPSVIEYLCIRHGEEGKGPKKLEIGAAGTGIVVTDWVGANDDWDLIRCIVGMNARLQIKH